MSVIHYRIVPHDGGFAYKLGDVFSEPFPSHGEAVRAAHRVAREQHTPGETRYIEFQDSEGNWHTQLAEGSDRPEVDVQA